MAITSSPWRSAQDSPSRQLLWELSRISIASNRDFYARLDRENQERELLHRKALAAAAAEHDRVRESAELACKELQIQVENERRRREEEQRRQLELKKQEQVESELEAKKRREEDRARTAELEARKAEEERKAEAAAVARAKKAEQDQKAAEEERINKEKQNAEMQRRIASLQSAKSTPPSAPTASTTNSSITKPLVQPPAPAVVANAAPAQLPNASELLSEHEHYIAIHRECKTLRTFMADEARKSPELKTAMGNMRREIRKSCGQLRAGKNANKVPLANILKTLKQALSISSPPYPVAKFIYPRPTMPAGTPDTGPSLLLYLLNIFSKAITAQLVSEAGIEPTEKADPIGTIASHIFALETFHWHGHSLINILIAKFHATCPVLFGIYGPENTTAGKERLGWARDDKDGPFIRLQGHQQRMTGLGAGFAGVSLRNYEKSSHQNPFPAIKYWTALSNIVNVPAAQRTDTHAMVMKAMIEGFEDRVLLFFGDAGKLALKMAVREWVKDVPGGGGVGMKALALLADVMRRERKIAL